MRALTTADFFEARYSRSVGVLFAVFGLGQSIVTLGLMLKGSTAMITAISEDAINPHLAVLGMTAIFLIYGVAGGLSAAIITDFFQGWLTILFSFLILPFALVRVGGMHGLRESLADPAMFEIVAPGEITAFYIAVISINALIGWVAQPGAMQVSGPGKTDLESRLGFTAGMFIKRVCTVAWVLTGLCAVGLYAGQDMHTDQIYGLMARDVLGLILPGLIGLFLASMLAAVMSTADTMMISSAALFTENIYRPLIGKGRSERHYLLVGRIASVVIVVCAIGFAYELESVVSGLEIFWKVASMMGIAFWAGLFWRRATVAGAWATTLVSFAVLLFTSEVSVAGRTLWDFNARFADALPATMVWGDRLYLPWQMILYLSAGLLTMIAVSLLTRPVDRERLDRVYACLRTPIQENEPECTPLTLPPGVQPAPRRVLVSHPDFEIPRPTAVSVVGFVVAWGVVGLIIATAFWIFSLGAG
jgi:Na+/proline symporter